MSLRPNRDRERRYLSGNTVYGSGRNSPHEGTKLDPSGYIERELKKKRVDRRSRLAQGALGRLARNNQGATPSPTTRTMATPTSTGGPDSPPVFNQTSATPGNNTSTGGSNNNTGDSTGPRGEGLPTQFQPPMATLNGKLVPMPWEMQMEWLQNTTQWAQQNAAWDNDVNQSQIELGQYLRELAQQRVKDQSGLANKQASKGMSFSSGNAWGIGDIANRYATGEADAKNYVQDLIGRIGVGGSERALGQSAYDQMQVMLQAEAARILAERAGTLGLGDQPRGPRPEHMQDYFNNVGMTIGDKEQAANTKPQKMDGVWQTQKPRNRKRRRKDKK